MRISIINNAFGATAAYAGKELRHFLSIYSNHPVAEGEGAEGADRYFILDVCSGTDRMEDHQYRIRSGSHNAKPAVTITAAAQSALLTGVYEALGEMGIYFNINGPVLKKEFRIEALDRTDRIYSPFYRNRGVRQHINFPMDISSYHVEQAKEYIRNLARMRMNSITFHSYTGQWHGYKTQEKEIGAGNFFYGQRHPVPDYKNIVHDVTNRKYFCIPEVEAVLQDDKLRAEFAVHWLNEVMYAAKEAGMNIVMSIELPDGETIETLIGLARNVLELYPHISAMEWISPEGGGEGEKLALEDITQKAVELFGDQILADGSLPYVPDSLPASLSGAMKSLQRAVRLYGHKNEILDGFKEIPIHIGLYVMCRDTLKMLKGIMERILPDDVIFTFLPAHGAKAVADNIAFMDFSDEDLQRTLVYSWIEFDGNMYLQQNSCEGIRQITEDAKSRAASGSVYGMCLNHWRTAENAFTISYSAAAMIQPLETGDFYEYYAGIYGITDVGSFRSFLEKLEHIDNFNRDYLFNIGFCYLGCWLGPKGLGWIRVWDVNNLSIAINEYQNAISVLNRCLSSTVTAEGIRLLRFFINRCECSVLHIRAIEKLCFIAEFADDETPEKLTPQEKSKVIGYCDMAMELCRLYIDKHMEMVEDRGCEGTAVSYYATIPVYIDHIRQYFVYGEKECRHDPDTFDKPPAPDVAYL